MRYCENTTQNHTVSLTYPSCLQNINSLIVEEGYLGAIPLFENAEKIINLDLAEELVASSEGRPLNKSMDMAFGISNEDSTNVKMLMVELRLNYSNPNNLNRIELEEKVNGSSIILNNIPPIYKRYIFIFKTEHIQQAINRLFRMAPRINSNYFAMDINLLKEAYF